MTCHFCRGAILQGDMVNLHHVTYKSQGGRETRPAHERCHRSFHSDQGDFKYWGRIGGQITAITRRWAFNLKNVRSNPAYDFDRAYYIAHYAH